jgi:hypothetical protein
VIARALLVSAGLALASSSTAGAGECPAPKVDVAGWALVRAAKMPGFTLRLPRTFTRDTASSTVEPAPSARWSAAARARLTMSHRTAAAAATPLPASGGRTMYSICEDRVGAATATIVAYGEGASTFVVHARIRWPDGETLDVRADATDRAHFEQLLAAVRTIRRVGA